MVHCSVSQTGVDGRQIFYVGQQNLPEIFWKDCKLQLYHSRTPGTLTKLEDPQPKGCAVYWMDCKHLDIRFTGIIIVWFLHGRLTMRPIWISRVEQLASVWPESSAPSDLPATLQKCSTRWSVSLLPPKIVIACWLLECFTNHTESF